jgi:hypothetical protein
MSEISPERLRDWIGLLQRSANMNREAYIPREEVEPLIAALRELAALREDAPKVSADDTLSNANLSKSCARLRGALRLLEDNDFLRCERENRDEHDNWCGCVPCQARAALAAQAAPSQDLRGGDP